MRVFLCVLPIGLLNIGTLALKQRYRDETEETRKVKPIQQVFSDENLGLRPNQTVVLATVGNAFSGDLFRNWLFHAERALDGSDAKVVVLAFDKNAIKMLSPLTRRAGGRHDFIVLNVFAYPELSSQSRQTGTLTQTLHNAEQNNTQNYREYNWDVGTMEYRAMMYARPDQIRAFLQLGHDVFFSDIDVVFLQDPLKSFALHPQFDILASPGLCRKEREQVMSKLGRNVLGSIGRDSLMPRGPLKDLEVKIFGAKTKFTTLNAGVMYFRATPKTVDYVQRWQALIWKHVDGAVEGREKALEGNQASFNQLLLEEHKSQAKTKVRVKEMPADVFVNGCDLNEDMNMRRLDQELAKMGKKGEQYKAMKNTHEALTGNQGFNKKLDHKKIVLVHADWNHGVDIKAKLFDSLGWWHPNELQ